MSHSFHPSEDGNTEAERPRAERAGTGNERGEQHTALTGTPR